MGSMDGGPEARCAASRPGVQLHTRLAKDRAPARAARAPHGLAAALALEPNIIAASGAIFLLGLGENLWRRFVPKYLEALGAPVIAIGLFGTTEDFLDGVYQYPGGWIADRYGRRRALQLFVVLAALGYVVYWAAPTWPWMFAGILFVSAWSSMASPALFAVVGDSLPSERRTMGFTVQAVVKRIPLAVAPTLGGLLIATLGVRGGVRTSLLATVSLAAVTLAVVARMRIPVFPSHATHTMRSVWRAFPHPLRWLLASDIFIRTCDGMVDIFLVLYAINVVHITAPEFGALVAVQAVAAMLAYAPGAVVADRVGRKPFVAATFLAFAAFPLAVILSHSFAGLVAAFTVGGLRELGEPARKALILHMAPAELRARSIGLYYFLRSLAIAPAAFIGGVLWKVSPALPFTLAGLIGLTGTAVFLATVDERHAG